MKFLITVFLILAIPSIIITGIPNIAVAQEKVSKNLAIQFLEVSQYKQIISETINSYVAQVPSKDQAKFRQLMEKAMGWETIKVQLADIVTKTYSKQELEEYIKFSQSSSGKAINFKSIEFSKQFSLLISQNIQNVINQKVK